MFGAATVTALTITSAGGRIGLLRGDADPRGPGAAHAGGPASFPLVSSTASNLEFFTQTRTSMLI
mgnify:CR=1 FL=1